jgi:hypothetical protein
MTLHVQHRENPFITSADIFDRTVRLTALRLEFPRWDIYRTDCPPVFVAELREHPPLLEVHYAHTVDELHTKLRTADLGDTRDCSAG